jgi:hypothetical protein
MREAQTQNMTEAFGGALEALAFITLAPAEEPIAAPVDATLVRVQLNGTVSAALELVAGASFGRQLAANLLGLEADDPEIELRRADALKELINVAAGAIIGTEIANGAAPREIGIPHIEPFATHEAWEAFTAAPGASVLDAEGNIIAIRIREAA